MSKKAYAIYNADDNSFWYNDGKGSMGFSSWTTDFKNAQLKHTLGDVFKTCCQLYEKDMMDLNCLVVVEVDSGRVDFENPIWIGAPDKMIKLWMEVEDEMRPLVLRGLHEDGLQSMHRIVHSWFKRRI